MKTQSVLFCLGFLVTSAASSMTIQSNGVPLGYRTSQHPGFEMHQPMMGEHPAYGGSGHRLCGPNQTTRISDELYRQELEEFRHQERLRQSGTIRRSF